VLIVDGPTGCGPARLSGETSWATKQAGAASLRILVWSSPNLIIQGETLCDLTHVKEAHRTSLYEHKPW
jgi:hypothetical protein